MLAIVVCAMTVVVFVLDVGAHWRIGVGAFMIASVLVVSIAEEIAEAMFD